jgi:membrane protease YdiL (CAAX protease family)
VSPVRNAKARFVAAVLVLAAFNVARAFGLVGPPYVAMPVLVAALALIAWRTGARADDLGLSRAALKRGVVYGLGAVGVVAAVLLLSAIIPATRGFLHDQRGAISGAHLIGTLFGSILLLTAVPEEFAFRGVLFGAGRQVWGARISALLSSVLFGLWHIAPTLDTAGGNTAIGRASHSGLGTLGVVLGTVFATSVAGLAFCWLRERSGSLLAAVLAHAATDGLALAAAWLTVH